MTNKLSPSLMCLDFGKIKETLKTFEEQNIELLHMDVMDGSFVPNYALGVDFVKKIRSMTSIKLDTHLMIEKPDEKVNWFDFKEGEYVSIHYESTYHLQRILSNLKDKGIKTAVALCPATPIINLENVLDVIDMVLIMSVNPGFAGQKLVPACLDKLKDTRKFLDERGFKNIEIEVDGNVSLENIPKMKANGANIFVGGSSSIFSKNDTLENNIKKCRELLK